MERILVLLNCFFNHSDIERTIESIQNTEYPCDIIMLENPSKYSDKIREIAIKYRVYKHYICSDNIEGNVFLIFCNTYPDIINRYRYICMSEADVVLDMGSLHESINILSTSPDNSDVISIGLHMNTVKYHSLPIQQWVPPPGRSGKYIVGHTGFQFIIFKINVLHDFINSINRKELSEAVALGVDRYYGISDTNLYIFIKRRGHYWLRTEFNNLDHIGWEHYMKHGDEYVEEKNRNLANGKIRSNIDISKYTLLELTE